jgi:hypothetical protein
MLNHNVNAERLYGYYLYKHKNTLLLENIINKIFEKSSQSNVERSICNRKNQYRQTLSRIRLIINRISPILILYLSKPVSRKEDGIWKLFQNINIAYHNICGRRNIRYTPIKYIIIMNNNHFKIR